jgi:hypothetical protein
MAQPITPDYGQQFLFPPALEDWVSADQPARFLREFVDQLDLPALGFALPAAVEGHPPYAPSLLLKRSVGYCAAVSVRNMISNVLFMYKNWLYFVE